MMKKIRFVPWKRRLYRLSVRHFFGNRNVKDRLFCYIFEHDRKSLLKLYNALNGTDYRDEQALQIVTLDNVVYMSMNNDVAFIQEMKKMLLTEYDEKKTMKAFQKEAYANGVAEGYKQGEAERQKLAQELQEMQRQMAELQKQNEELRLFTDALHKKGITLAELSQAVQLWPTKKEG